MEILESGAHPRHPIAVVADRTGLSQDVLRVWERRYGVVAPARGPGGQRLYSDDDITRLRLLRGATEAGRPISQVAALAQAELEEMSVEDAQARSTRSGTGASAEPMESLVSAALAHTLALDGVGLDMLLRQAAATHGLPSFLESVVTPFLQRVGEEWHSGRLSPSHEHLASAVLQSVLLDLTRSIVTWDSAPRLLIATPSGERHAIGAIMAGLAATLEGWRVIFLGADLPASEIASAAAITGARAVGVSVVYVSDRDAMLKELRALRAALPQGLRLFAGGAGSALLRRDLKRNGAHIDVFTDLGALRAALRAEAA